MGTIKFTPDEEAFIREHWGDPVAWIADQLERDYEKVNYYARRHLGLPNKGRRNALPENVKEAARELLDSGHTFGAVATMMGISKTSASRLLYERSSKAMVFERTKPNPPVAENGFIRQPSLAKLMAGR